MPVYFIYLHLFIFLSLVKVSWDALYNAPFAIMLSVQRDRIHSYVKYFVTHSMLVCPFRGTPDKAKKFCIVPSSSS